MIETEILKYGTAGVAVAALIIVFKIVCKFLTAMEKFEQTIATNTQATTEMYEFLRNLNGSLKRNVRNKLRT